MGIKITNTINVSGLVRAFDVPELAYTQEFTTFDSWQSPIAMSGDGTTLFVTSPSTQTQVLVYERTGSTWLTGTSLLVGNTVTSIATDETGEYVVIGQSEATNSFSTAGRASIYRRTGATWGAGLSVQQIDANNTTDERVLAGRFGEYVAMSSDLSQIFVTHRGTNNVFAFTRSGTTWNFESSNNVSSGSQFTSIDCSEDGSVFAFSDNTDTGVYTYNGTSFTQEIDTAFSFGDARNSREFISGDGNTIVVSDPPFSSGQGRVTVVFSNGGLWDQNTTITSPNPVNGARFGEDVVISRDGNFVLVREGYSGAYGSGPAYYYLYERNGQNFDLLVETLDNDIRDGSGGTTVGSFTASDNLDYVASAWPAVAGGDNSKIWSRVS